MFRHNADWLPDEYADCSSLKLERSSHLRHTWTIHCTAYSVITLSDTYQMRVKSTVPSL